MLVVAIEAFLALAHLYQPQVEVGDWCRLRIAGSCNPPAQGRAACVKIRCVGDLLDVMLVMHGGAQRQSRFVRCCTSAYSNQECTQLTCAIKGRDILVKGRQIGSETPNIFQSRR